MDNLPVSVFKPPVTAPSTLSFLASALPISPPLRFSTLSRPDEGLLEGTGWVVGCTITSGDNRISTHSLLDCGATGFAFVHEQFVRQHNLPRYTLRLPRALEVIDGRPILSGDVAELVRVILDIGGHREELAAFVTSLGQYLLVLGIPWPTGRKQESV